MKYFVSFNKDEIEIRILLKDSENIADILEVIRPGEKFYHLSYEELKDAGEGEFELVLEEASAYPD